MKRFRSLHVRLLSTYIAMALLLLITTGLVFSHAIASYAQKVHNEQNKELLARAQRLVEESDGTPEMKAQLVRETFPELEVTVMINPRVLYVPSPFSGSPLSSAVTPFALVEAEQNEAAVLVTLPSTLRNTALYIAVRPFASPGLSALYQEVALVLAAALALALLLGWSFSRWLSRPVAQLTAATAAVAAGDFHQRVQPTGTTELDQLAGQFNQMAARLEESFRSLSAERDLARRFAADAAHELKTPLTALRAYHEVAEANPERTAQVMRPIGRQVERLERIIAALLQLSRLSEGTGIELTVADAADIIRPLLPGFEALVSEYGHRFRVHFPCHAMPVRQDRRLIELVLSNLVENGCKFTPAGGELTLSLTPAGESLAIAVSDTGPGIPEEEIPRIFHRFHRGSDTQEIPGSGLGLAIVQEATLRLGGTIAVDSTPGQGSTFTLLLPLQPEPLPNA